MIKPKDTLGDVNPHYLIIAIIHTEAFDEAFEEAFYEAYDEAYDEASTDT